MDKKDNLLESSLDKLREITTRNLRRVSDDIWGVLKPEQGKENKPEASVDPYVAKMRDLAKDLPGDYRDDVLEKQLQVIETLSRKQAKATSDTLWDDFPPFDLSSALSEIGRAHV